jgi:hypothetical protein
MMPMVPRAVNPGGRSQDESSSYAKISVVVGSMSGKA